MPSHAKNPTPEELNRGHFGAVVIALLLALAASAITLWGVLEGWWLCS